MRYEESRHSNIFTTNGCSSHSKTEREALDYYATDPECLRQLLKYEEFGEKVWEPCCGGGHLVGVLQEAGKDVRYSDIVDRIDNEILDFSFPVPEYNGDIITNPPYSMAMEFVENALRAIPEGRKVAMFLKLTFLEGRARKELFKIAPPTKVYVFSERQKCAIRGDFSSIGSSAVAYAWFVWRKGFKGDPVIKWI